VAAHFPHREAFVDLGIHPRHETPGEQRCACPECARTKRRTRDDALAVKIDPDGGATWVCHRCGWKGCLRRSGEPQRARRTTAPPPPEPVPAPPIGAVTSTWERCPPVTPDSVAGRYLIGRGCTLPHPDGHLRWHPRCQHPSGDKGPALVALVTHAVTAEPMTLHKTWLMADGSGKARLDKPRLLKGGYPKKGGVIRLWPDEEVTYGLAIAEGIETALSAGQLFTPVWSCIDAGNLSTLPVLDAIQSLTIVVDHDEQGILAANECGRRWAEDGAEVVLWVPPTEGQDLNDYLGSGLGRVAA
jgi:putative DNA primase/helicase